MDPLSEQPPVLGAPVEPPADVWANAIAGAFESTADGHELEAHLPGTYHEPPDSAWVDDFETHEQTEAPGDILTDEFDTPDTGGALPGDPGSSP